MSYRLLSDSWPIAAKDHRCIWCGEPIPKGEKHRHERSVYADRMQDHRWHKECDEDAADLFSCGEEEFTPYEAPRPAKVSL